MALRINTNVGALNAHRQLVNTEVAMNKSMGKLSSGYRINTAGDDAAGLVTANGLRASVKVLNVQAQTALQEKADLQIAEGDANTIENILERMTELGAKGTSTATTAEWTALAAEITRIQGTYTGPSAASLTAAALGVSTFSTTAASSAITTVSGILGDIGASMNTNAFTYANLLTKIENTSASESAIRDVDMAAEMVTFTKTQIMLQAGTAMLAQANTSSQSVLSLFQ